MTVVSAIQQISSTPRQPTSFVQQRLQRILSPRWQTLELKNLLPAHSPALGNHSLKWKTPAASYKSRRRPAYL